MKNLEFETPHVVLSTKEEPQCYMGVASVIHTDKKTMEKIMRKTGYIDKNIERKEK